MNIPLSKRHLFFAFGLVLVISFFHLTRFPIVPEVYAQHASSAPPLSPRIYMPLVLNRYPQEIAYLAALDGQTTDIFIINSDGTGKKRITYNAHATDFPDCNTFSWSPSGDKLAFLNDYNIYRINADGTGLVNLTNYLDALCFTWAPDSSKIAFVGWTTCGIVGCYDIYQVGANGSGLTRLTYTNLSKSNPSWSPDGTQIAFTSADETRYGRIYVMNTDGTGLDLLADGQNPLWSPDGTKIAFFKNGDSLYIMNPNGTGQIQIFPQYVEWLTWSPDSKQLAFKANSEVYLINADGSGLINLSNDGPSNDGAPTWSPDGKKIAFESARNTPDQSLRLYVINADGSGLTPLTSSDSTSVWDFSPKWRP